MQFKPHISFLVEERSQIGYVKREISRSIAECGFNETEKGKIDIILTELASNIVKHTTGGGELLIKILEYNRECFGIEILSIDSGPGMRNHSYMLEDGISTSGTQGEGLGAIKRLSDDFQICSQEDTGTVILSRLYRKDFDRKKVNRNPKFNSGILMVCKPGETKCGDGGCLIQEKENIYILTVDGLGHGPDAEFAASSATQVFMTNKDKSHPVVLKQIHDEIKRTRGVVGAVARINIPGQYLEYAGVGNIAARLIGPEINKTLLSYNGTLGYVIPHVIHNHKFALRPQLMLVIHSDGIKSRWDMSKYPDLHKYDLTVIAALIYKDNRRKTDDTLIVVAKLN